MIEWSEKDKILLLGVLCKEIGEYEIAYDILQKLYRNCFLLFANNEKKLILLINLSKLAHENSKYVSCGLFAKKQSGGIILNHLYNYLILKIIVEPNQYK